MLPSTEVSGCPACEATATAGWTFFVDDHGVQRVRRCECFWRSKQTWAHDVPDKYRQASFETYRVMKGNRDAYDLGKGFARGDQDLYLCGGVGAGKTLLACAILNDLWTTKRIGRFARVPIALFNLQPSRASEDKHEALMHTLTTEPVLVLDDVGSERDQASDFTRRTLLMIYEARVDAGHRTIWTSNYPLSPDLIASQRTLSEFLTDDRLPSRIAGRADVVWIACKDQRIKRKDTHHND